MASINFMAIVRFFSGLLCMLQGVLLNSFPALTGLCLLYRALFFRVPFLPGFLTFKKYKTSLYFLFLLSNSLNKSTRAWEEPLGKDQSFPVSP